MSSSSNPSTANHGKGWICLAQNSQDAPQRSSKFKSTLYVRRWPHFEPTRTLAGHTRTPGICAHHSNLAYEFLLIQVPSKESWAKKILIASLFHLCLWSDSLKGTESWTYSVSSTFQCQPQTEEMTESISAYLGLSIGTIWVLVQNPDRMSSQHSEPCENAKSRLVDCTIITLLLLPLDHDLLRVTPSKQVFVESHAWVLFWCQDSCWNLRLHEGGPARDECCPADLAETCLKAETPEKQLNWC